jgi:hypothetical protein
VRRFGAHQPSAECFSSDEEFFQGVPKTIIAANGHDYASRLADIK